MRKLRPAISYLFQTKVSVESWVSELCIDTSCKLVFLLLSGSFQSILGKDIEATKFIIGPC